MQLQPFRPIRAIGPHTVETIRQGMRHFAEFEWTPEKKIPSEIHVDPLGVAGPLPETIDGVPVRIMRTCDPFTLEMQMRL